MLADGNALPNNLILWTQHGRVHVITCYFSAFPSGLLTICLKSTKTNISRSTSTSECFSLTSTVFIWRSCSQQLLSFILVWRLHDSNTIVRRPSLTTNYIGHKISIKIWQIKPCQFFRLLCIFYTHSQAELQNQGTHKRYWCVGCSIVVGMAAWRLCCCQQSSDQDEGERWLTRQVDCWC